MMAGMKRRPRAKSSGITLSSVDAAVAKGMLRRGDRQHDVAAWFGVNPGRIAEIATGAAFDWVDAADEDDLPPPGPYPTGKQAMEARKALDTALEALAAAETSLSKLGLRSMRAAR